jgi:methionyl-tRNA synthetase
VREYLGAGEEFWSWEHIFEPVSYFTGEGHKLKFLPPRTDFFTRHESQYAQNSDE